MKWVIKSGTWETLLEISTELPIPRVGEKISYIIPVTQRTRCQPVQEVIYNLATDSIIVVVADSFTR